MRKSKTSRKYKNTKKTKSITDFKKSKSISIISTMTDLKKKSTVGELYDVDELQKIMNSRCNKNVSKKIVEGVEMKKISKNICNCLFEKNKNLNLYELEERLNNKLDTPGTECIKIVDNYVSKNSKKRKTGTSKKNN